MEAITDLPIPQIFTDVVRGEPTTIEEAVDAYLNDPARLQQWLDSNATRTSDFNYELRHPGHADQSVHNPHKGGSSAYAAGAWKPVSDDDATAMRRAVAQDVVGPGPALVDFTMQRSAKEQATGELYVNGNVQARFPKGMSDKQKQQHLSELDESLAYTPKGMLGNPDFPIAVHYGGKGARKAAGKAVSEDAEVPSGGTTIFVNSSEIKKGIAPELKMELEGAPARISGDFTYQDIARTGGVIPKSVVIRNDSSGWESAQPFAAWEHNAVKKSNAGNTVQHEIGHAVATFNATKSSRTQDVNAVVGAARSVKAPSPLSLYSNRSDTEFYAELFSAWAGSKGKTDRADVQAAAKAGKWGAP
jgi:hypothetical protein